MKVSEHGKLWFGDVIVTKVDTNIFTGEPMQQVYYVENVVTWIRNIETHGPRDENDPNDFDVILMDDNGEVSHIKDVTSLNDCEYSHCAFKRGAWHEDRK